jgi:hypothetical protein
VADTTPDAFSFASQTDVALSTVTPSNSITVSGIDAAADIAITACSGSACEYAVNGGTWTSAAGTVSSGDTVQVRQTSSANYSTATALTLDIGGVSGAFSITTEAEPVADTTPDAFSFASQTDVALSTVTPSNSITVSGIDAPADIAITACSGSSCQYAVNRGTWTAAAGTVADGDTVQVRQTSSSNYNTETELTLDIGGVSAVFTVSTEAAPVVPVPVVEGPTPTGTGTARAFVTPSDDGEGCVVGDAQFLEAPVAPPEGVTLPHGLFGFTSSGCASGFSVEVSVEYPSDIPAGSAYYKYDDENGWYTIPATISGNTVTFTITDNGPGDLDPAVGTIRDPGGIGTSAGSGSPTAIPTLPQWALALLAGLMILLVSTAFGRGRLRV